MAQVRNERREDIIVMVVEVSSISTPKELQLKGECESSHYYLHIHSYRSISEVRGEQDSR